MLLTAFAIMLVMSSAFAAITVTVSTPATGTSYNNFPANIKKIPITFAITDSNTAAPSDFNVSIKWYNISTTQANGTYIIKDANIFDYNTNENATATFYCDVKNDGPATATCTYMWELPSNITAPPNTYFIDVNGTEWFKASVATEADKNGTTSFIVNNSMGTSASVKSLLLPVSAILIAALMILSIVAITVLGADPTKTAVMVVAGAIVIAVVAMIIGFIIVQI